MDTSALITFLGFILAVIIVLFTGQKEEIKENIKYMLRMFVKKIKVFKRGHTEIQQSLVLGDKSKFICDVTIPDGIKVKVNQKFTKIWEIQNVGSVRRTSFIRKTLSEMTWGRSYVASRLD